MLAQNHESHAVHADTGQSRRPCHLLQAAWLSATSACEPQAAHIGLEIEKGLVPAASCHFKDTPR